MCKYTPHQLNEVEQNLMKIKAVADLMAFAERDGGFCFPMESMREVGDLLGGWAEDSMKIFNPSADECGGES